MIIDILPHLNQRRIVLASQSPRRREILQLIGLEFDSQASSFAEDLDKSSFESPNAYAQKTAEEKALDVWRKQNQAVHLVIGSDTIVVSDGKILEKPKSEADAIQMLSNLSGRWHTVVTAVALVCEGRVQSFCEEAKVCFDDLTDEMISAYVKTGEPMDKAGAYGIQGSGGAFVKKIDGCFFCVMGLPMNAVGREIRKLVEDGVL
ncbi:N-acetylserotonin O-methyltransferase-like protein [Gracilariopsis chorda]|uniref:N-acetylserotonin O-methyltransferase-like protein n=1 Tax=Gracilariopsis chorda TaxID=448386 RepID=A0A2V3J5H6_9FLOR|nr:N-acetylserotonin O-methyltransferase-like protein [Gracilariopsis chorda]|eukprot:PXF49686.1 N-acetylserotonin O-methyltransferase-like protein [Gracilariopsis chorda]